MVLLVIDTQKLITNKKLYNFDVFVSNVNELIVNARKNEIEVIFIRHDDGINSELTKGKDGFEIYEQFSPQKNEKVFDKTVNSAFKDSGLLEYLKNKKVKDVVITGLQTDYCIDASVKCAFEHGFNNYVPTLCNSTVDNIFMTAEQSYKYYNEFIWNGRYAKSISVNDIIKLFETSN